MYLFIGPQTQNHMYIYIYIYVYIYVYIYIYMYICHMVGVDMVLAQYPQNTLYHRIYIIHD